MIGSGICWSLFLLKLTKQIRPLQPGINSEFTGVLSGFFMHDLIIFIYALPALQYQS
jgi:hypothetical protein